MKKLISSNESVHGVIEGLEEWEEECKPTIDAFIAFGDDDKYELVRKALSQDLRENPYSLDECWDEAQDSMYLLHELDETMEDDEDFEIEEGLYDELKAIIKKYSDLYDEANSVFHGRV